MALTQVNSAGIKDDVIVNADVKSDAAIAFSKLQDVSATDRILGRDSSGAGDIEEITPANVRTMLNVEDGADVTDATNVNAAGAIMHTDLGTKGQIIVGDGSGDATILSVGGTNGHVLTVDSGEASGVKWAAASGGTTINNATANELVTVASTTSELDAEANLTFDGTTLQVTGDIQGAGNDGTANQLKWDKSDDTLYFRDNVKASFGIGGDLDIYHDGTDSRIKSETNQLIIQSDDLLLRNEGSSETYARCQNNGSVELYYDNAKKFETTSGGAKVTGTLDVTGNIHFPADQVLYLGAQGAVTGSLYATSNNVYLNNESSGHVYIQNSGSNDDSNIYIRARDGENSIICHDDGEVELFYDGDYKYRTTSAGATHWGQQLIIKDGQAVWFRPATNQSSTYIEWWDDGSSQRQGYVGYGNGTEGTSAFYIEHELNGMMKFFTNNTEHFRIEANGDLKATDTSIGSISDQRLKKNITDFTYDLSKFKQFKPRTFDWINPEYHGNKSGERGFVAQELESIDGSLVGRSELEYGKDDKGNVEPNLDLDIIKADDGTDFAKDAKLGTNDAMYISVIQQLITKIETLETKVAVLEAG